MSAQSPKRQQSRAESGCAWMGYLRSLVPAAGRQSCLFLASQEACKYLSDYEAAAEQQTMSVTGSNCRHPNQPWPIWLYVLQHLFAFCGSPPSGCRSLLRLFCQQLRDAWGCQRKKESDILRRMSVLLQHCKTSTHLSQMLVFFPGTPAPPYHSFTAYSSAQGNLSN